MQLTPLSQRDPRWGKQHLGTSTTLIEDYGCTLTVLAIKLGLTPLQVNERLNSVDGFAPSNPNDPFNPQKNLINWTKLSQAFPGVRFTYRYRFYDDNVNEHVKKSLPCLVEVDAAPIHGTRHWVLYIGNQQLIDPWDGKVKPTSSYKALGAAIIEGQTTIQPQPTPAPQTYRGLDLTNTDSVKAAVDTWADVVSGRYISLDQYNLVLEKSSKGVLPDPNYTEMKSLGYTTIDDINKVLKEKDDTILNISKEIAEVRDRNRKLAGTIEEMEGQSSTTADLGIKALEQNKELTNTLTEIAKITGAEKVTPRNILTSVLNIKDIADRLLKRAESQENKTIQIVPEVQVEEEKNPKTFNTESFMKLLQLIPSKKEVKENGQ